MVCLQKGEQSGIQQGPGIIIRPLQLLKYVIPYLSKNCFLSYTLYVFGLHVRFEKGPPIFFVNYNQYIYYEMTMQRKGEVKTAWNGVVEKRGSRRYAIAFLFVWWNDAFNNAEITKHKKKLNETERD